ncbi:MAG: hypothetical protein JSW10_06445 [Pseudomonadota bacterium]|nr:MAG: hypothetical protein JSW10_06445 [Pseudomonadota bacterium]
MRKRCCPGLILVALAFAALGGCATYSEKVKTVEGHLRAQDPEKALQALDKIHYPDKDQVLYQMDKATLLRMAGDYRASNTALEQAKVLIEELTAPSVTEQAARFTVNDASTSYIGTPLEQLMVHVYAALNYLELGDIGAARVEALQMDQVIRRLNEYRKGSRPLDVAFARYLSGIVFEHLLEWSDAMIACRKAYNAYTEFGPVLGVELPASLKHALLRLAEQQGLDAELAQYRKSFGITQWQSLASRSAQAEIIFFLHNGLAPIKRQRSIIAPVPSSGQLIRISVPEYEGRGGKARIARLQAGDELIDTVRVENIDAVARLTLEEQMPAIMARTAARNAIKYTVAHQAGRQDDLAGLLVNLFNVATEIADTRSWLTLPGEIQMARLLLPPGRYDLRVDVLGSGGVMASRTWPGIELGAGDKRYLSYHWIPSGMVTTRH